MENGKTETEKGKGELRKRETKRWRGEERKGRRPEGMREGGMKKRKGENGYTKKTDEENGEG